MTAELFGTAQELKSRGEPFAIATVIDIQGSGSAKPGSKVIIDSRGRVVLGWVGGGCAESTVCQAALESMSDGKVRVITLDLTDEIFGVGMPCGGMMQVYIEPTLPKPDLVIVSISAVQAANFVKQYAEAGITTPLFSDYPPPPRIFERQVGQQAGKVGLVRAGQQTS